MSLAAVQSSGLAEHSPSPLDDPSRVRAAVEYLRPLVVRTDVRRLPWLERLTGVPVWAKLEVQQHTGSFKYREARYRLRHHPPLRPVIAASAGNHGLAVAQVARELGIPATICIPTTASRLKRERIVAAGAALVEWGNSLDQATEYARELAALRGWEFLSPYNDLEVVYGNATVGAELLEQVPDAATWVVPAGGGGLVCGMGVAARAAGAPVRLVACGPERYDSLHRSVRAGRAVRVVHQPTFADGLAVNLDEDSVTLSLADALVDRWVELTEEELAAAAYALLVHESMLVEPAGAAAVAACLRLARAGELRGPVALPLCGGNLHHLTLSRIQQYPYTRPELLRLLDLTGRRAADEPVVRGPRTPEPRACGPARTAATDLEELMRACEGELERARVDLDDFQAYCRTRALPTDAELGAGLRAHAGAAAARLRGCRDGLRGGADPAELSRAESVLRWGLQTVSYVRGALEWCSPAYDQAGVAQFFGLGAQDSPGVNYERYHTPEVRRLELQLAGVLGVAPERTALTVVSSGMAAYSLVEQFLLRHRLSAGDTVLLAPYIYFESAEQLLGLGHLRFETAADYSLAALLEAVERVRPRVLFVDPLTNTAEQRMVDLPGLIGALAERGEPVTVVVDGTMLSGAMAGCLRAARAPVEVLLYESCSKYLQFGLDAGMAGYVAHAVEDAAAFDRLRRNSGAILYRHGALIFPTYSPEAFRARMERISAGALRLARALAARPEVAAAMQVVHPGLDDHPDAAIARGLPWLGGCVTFAPLRGGDSHRDALEALIQRVLLRAAAAGVQVVKGVSFGFSVPRISAAASMAEASPPFLRLYAGDRGEAQADALAGVLAECIGAWHAGR